MIRIPTLVAMIAVLSGCYAATRSTVDMGQAEQSMADARAAGAPERAVYAWTMADEYMKKARDEWGRSDFETADKMLQQATKWANEAAAIARAGGAGPQWGVEDALKDTPKDAPKGAPTGAPDAPEPAPAETPTQGVWQ